MRTPLAIIALVSSTAAASAQEPATIPDLVTVDRLRPVSSLAVDFNVTLWDEVLGIDLLGMGLTLRGQYMTDVGSGEWVAGGYATLPLGYGSAEGALVLPDGEESEFGVGNLELGAAGASAAGPGTLLVRFGVALPTAGDENDDFVGPVLNFPSRITDIVLYPDDTTTLRLSGSYLYSQGAGFFRADAGIDIPFADEDMSPFNDEDPLLRLNLAAGARIEPLAAAVELVTLATTSDVDDDADRFIHTIAVSARYVGGQAQPVLAIVVPLDDSINDAVDLTVTVGVTAEM